MTCEQVQELIHAYIDGELDLVSNLEIEVTSVSVRCAGRNIMNILNLRVLVQGGAQYFVAPDILKKTN